MIAHDVLVQESRRPKVLMEIMKCEGAGFGVTIVGAIPKLSKARVQAAVAIATHIRAPVTEEGRQRAELVDQLNWIDEQPADQQIDPAQCTARRAALRRR